MKKLFNLKRLLKLRNKSGFTLVEVIIASVLLGLLIVGVVTFISPLFDIIKSNKQNARATMLAETIDTYISGSIRGAQVVEVFANTTLEEVKTQGIDETTISDTNLRKKVEDAKSRLFDFMNAGDNADNFEIRCIGITWKTDDSTLNGAKKQILTNCRVDNNFSGGYDNKLQIKSDGDTKVFDDSIYNNLYPRISLETFSKLDDDDSETGDNASGYKISSKVYLDKDCYNVLSAAARENTNLSFEGAAYVECANITSASEIIFLKNEQDGIDSGRSGRQFSENGSNYYYPDTFIYYIVPK